MDGAAVLDSGLPALIGAVRAEARVEGERAALTAARIAAAASAVAEVLRHGAGPISGLPAIKLDWAAFERGFGPPAPSEGPGWLPGEFPSPGTTLAWLLSPGWVTEGGSCGPPRSPLSAEVGPTPLHASALAESADRLAPPVASLPTSVAACRRLIASAESSARAAEARALVWQRAAARVSARVDGFAAEAEAVARAHDSAVRARVASDRLEAETAARRSAETLVRRCEAEAARHLEAARAAARLETEQAVAAAGHRGGGSGSVGSASDGGASAGDGGPFFSLSEVMAIKARLRAEAEQAAGGATEARRVLSAARAERAWLREALRGALAGMGLPVPPPSMHAAAQGGGGGVADFPAAWASCGLRVSPDRCVTVVEAAEADGEAVWAAREAAVALAAALAGGEPDPSALPKRPSKMVAALAELRAGAVAMRERHAAEADREGTLEAERSRTRDALAELQDVKQELKEEVALSDSLRAEASGAKEEAERERAKGAAAAEAAAAQAQRAVEAAEEAGRLRDAAAGAAEALRDAEGRAAAAAAEAKAAAEAGSAAVAARAAAEGEARAARAAAAEQAAGTAAAEAGARRSREEAEAAGAAAELLREEVARLSAELERARDDAASLTREHDRLQGAAAASSLRASRAEEAAAAAEAAALEASRRVASAGDAKPRSRGSDRGSAGAEPRRDASDAAGRARAAPRAKGSPPPPPGRPRPVPPPAPRAASPGSGSSGGPRLTGAGEQRPAVVAGPAPTAPGSDAAASLPAPSLDDLVSPTSGARPPGAAASSFWFSEAEAHAILVAVPEDGSEPGDGWGQGSASPGVASRPRTPTFLHGRSAGAPSPSFSRRAVSFDADLDSTLEAAASHLPGPSAAEVDAAMAAAARGRRARPGPLRSHDDGIRSPAAAAARPLPPMTSSGGGSLFPRIGGALPGAAARPSSSSATATTTLRRTGGVERSVTPPAGGGGASAESLPHSSATASERSVAEAASLMTASLRSEEGGAGPRSPGSQPSMSSPRRAGRGRSAFDAGPSAEAQLWAGRGRWKQVPDSRRGSPGRRRGGRGGATAEEAAARLLGRRAPSLRPATASLRRRNDGPPAPAVPGPPGAPGPLGTLAWGSPPAATVPRTRSAAGLPAVAPVAGRLRA